jgi:DNA-binding transcriptional ArsR family regulator
MNILPDPDSEESFPRVDETSGIPKPSRPSSGCGFECKEKLFHALADRSRFSILDTLCDGAQTVTQIAAATGLSQLDVSIQLERLLDCGCVTPTRTTHSVLYALRTPRLLQLEAVVDEFLVASFKAVRVSNYD